MWHVAVDFRHMASTLGPMPTISLLALPYDDNFYLIDFVKRGVPARALVELAEAFHTTVPNLAARVAISRRTLERRLADNARLTTEEAERAVRLARLYAKAKDVFEDDEEAANWFSDRIPSLAGHTPFELCASEAGAREVDQTLGRIEHGVFA